MANTVLSRPATGGHISIPAETGATIVLDFIATQSTLERSNDNLVFRFDDGADVVIENFYTTFGQQDIPQFEVDGQLVSGADFFNAFGPDLIPAAGPDAASQRSARYNENADSDLASGVDHLDGLDMSVSGTEAPTAFVAFDSAPPLRAAVVATSHRRHRHHRRTPPLFVRYSTPPATPEPL